MLEPTKLEGELFSMWTVYDHPIDMPSYYVARRHVITRGKHFPMTDVYYSTSLQTIRAEFVKRGLVCFARDASDDPKIIETWF